MAKLKIHNWYSFPQMEGPDICKIEEGFVDNPFSKPVILFICPIFPCNGEGCCNKQMLSKVEEQSEYLKIRR